MELNEFLVGPGAVVDLSDATGDYTSKMVEDQCDQRFSGSRRGGVARAGAVLCGGVWT